MCEKRRKTMNKFKENKWLVAFIVACVLLVAAVALAVVFATQKQPEPTDGPNTVIDGGAEIGVYYYDMVNGEVLLTLSEGKVFTLAGPEVNKTGSYTLTDGNMVLDFVRDEDGTTTAQVTENVITLSYQNATMTFLRKLNYTVSFHCDGAVQNQTVLNGKAAQQPADPAKPGHVFLGWYADEALTEPYAFDGQAITGDITLYAKFVSGVVGQNEYIIDFDLGYEGAEVPAAQQTVGGKLLTLPEDPTRDGYTFCGWWISMFEDGQRLSYGYDEELVFDANTTLFALWAESAGSKVAAPGVNVFANSVKWDAVDGATGYHIVITDEQGNELLNEDVGATTKSFAFEELAAGIYKVEVLSIAANSANNSQATVRYYHNKALGRVSQFQVIDGVLAFNAVDNAEKYLVTIECGNPDHSHTLFDNGNSTTFRFADCTMQPGGIRITVTASANGFATSTSEVFVYDRSLAAVESVVYNENEDVFVWNRVENATGYLVTVTAGDLQETFAIGNKTSFSTARYSGQITVAVTPVTEGYNAPEATTASCQKLAPATPEGLQINGMLITWEPAMGATAYEVMIGAQVFNTETNSLSLEEVSAEIVVGQSYDISVKAVNNDDSSPYCKSVPVGYRVMNMELTYSANTVYWNPVIGATAYEVRVNGITVANGVEGNSCRITLTKAGINTIEVRFTDNGGSEWASMEVNAFRVTYNTRSLNGEVTEYVAIGDTLSLPQDFTNNGYSFAGWYTSPAASAGNGKKIENPVFTGNADTVYYADWAPESYKVSVQVEGFDLTNMEQDDFFTVTYTHDFFMEVPVSSNPAYTSFVGWFTGPSGSGTRLTDEHGFSVAPFGSYNDIIAYPFFDTDILTFTKAADGSYEVKAGPNIDNVATLNIPAEYDGAPVKTILENAFNGCNNLKVVNIPDSIVLVGSSAFSGATNLETINVYKVEGNHDVFYSSFEGALNRHDMGTVYLDVVPRAKTGTLHVADYVNAIRSKAFQMSNLSKVVISKSVTTIYEKSFYRCASLVALEFEGNRPEALTLSSEIFYDCPRITSIRLPAKINTFDPTILDTLTQLAVIEVEDGGDVYGSVNGMLTNALKDTILYAPATISGAFTVPKGIQHIADNAFRERTGLTAIIIPNYVKSVGSYAFYGCPKIRNVRFVGNRNSDLSIGVSSFAGCTALDKVTFEGGKNGELEKGVITIGTSAFTPGSGEKRLRSVVFGDGVNIAQIGTSAFSGQSALYNLSFGNNIQVVEIGANAFANCTMLQTIAIPVSTVKIGNNAFKGCTGIISVSFPEGGSDIEFGTGAFSGCTRLTEVNLPSTLVNFDGTVFKGCDSIRQINVAENSPYLTSEAGVLYSKDFTRLLYYPKALDADWQALSQLRWDSITTIGESVFEGNEKVTEFVIMTKVTTIGAGAFSGCTNLTAVSSEDANASGVLVIGNDAFKGCTKLSQVTIPNYTTTIGNNAFQQNKFTSFNMPESVTTIGTGAFKSNTNLKTITITALVTSIGNGAFSGCTGLEQVIFMEGVKLKLGGTNGSDGVFQRCLNLKSIDFKDRVTTIGNGAFNGSGITNNAQMTGLVLGHSVTYIGNSAFSGANSLQSITIPNTVIHIGDSAFANSALNTITFESGGAQPLEFGTGVFANAKLTEITFPSRTAKLYTNSDKIGKDTVANIAGMFTGNANLKNIHVEDGCKKFASVDGVLYGRNAAGEIAVLLYCPVKNMGRNGTGELFVPNTVVQVMNVALRNVTKIHTVTFEEFEKDDARYGTQRLYLGLEQANTSVAADYSVIGGLDTNTITTVNIPSHMASFGARAIGKTKDIVTLNINPDASELIIGYNAFYTSRIADFNFPGVKSVYTLAFGQCDDMRTLVFGEKSTITSLPVNALNGVKISTFVVPASVVTLESQVFFFADMLESISFAPGSQIRTINSGVFQGCASLRVVDLSNAVRLETIGDRVFSGTMIEEFSFPEGIKSVGGDMFSDCAKLKKITLPSTFTANMLYTQKASGEYISLFDSCTALEEVVVAPGNMELSAENGVLYDRAKTIVYYYPLASKLTDYQLPETVRVIEKFAFKQFQGKTLNLPSKLERIEDNAFQAATLESIVIPATVVHIGYKAFAPQVNDATLQTVIFEAGSRLETIGDYAFSGNTKLTALALPDSVKSIGLSAFNDCSSLETLILPAGLTELKDQAFARCARLHTVVLQQGLVNIGVNVFKSTAITELRIPASVRTIADMAFFELPKLSSVVFADGSLLDSVGAQAFSNCPLLQSVNLPDSVTTLGEAVFAYDGNLKSANIPSKVTDIPAKLFDGCINLTGATIPGSVMSIGERAFANNIKMTTIEIPASVMNIGASAFEGCSGATSIVFAAGSGITALGEDMTGKANIFKDTSSATTVVLPDGLESIGGHAFENCGVTELTLPSALIEIGVYAFANCDALEAVTISSEVNYLGDYAFFDCDNMLDATLSFGVEYLGTLVFGCCEKLQTAYIPATVVHIGSNPFAGCIAAGDVVVDPDNEFLVVEDGILYDLSKTILYSYPMSRTDETFTIPSKVTSVAPGAFAGSQLKSITYPKRLGAIQPYTFAYCSKLTDVTIESGVSAIGDGAFRGCASLNNVTIPASASQLGNYAFADCSKLNNFTFSGTTTYTIGTHFFENCTSMKAVTLPTNFQLTMEDARQHGLTTVDRNGVEKLATGAKQAIPSYMFAGTGITSAVIPKTVKWIGTEGVFMNCTKMRTVKFEASSLDCTYIGNYYFYGCKALTTVNIPRGATAIFSNSIGYSFANCTSLKTVTINYGNVGVFSSATSGHMFEGCTKLTSVTFKGLGSNVTYMDYVGPYFFAGCTSLSSITLAENASICDGAFSGCTKLADVKFGKQAITEATVLLLGDRAFEGCTALSALSLPELRGYLGENVFAGWQSTQAMMINQSKEALLELLSTGAFKGCNAVVYDKDFNEIKIDPETGLAVEQ